MQRKKCNYCNKFQEIKICKKNSQIASKAKIAENAKSSKNIKQSKNAKKLGKKKRI